MRTSKAWINIYLNNVTRDASDLVDLIFLLNMTASDISTLIFGVNSKIKAYMAT